MDIRESKPPLNPVLMFANTEYNKPYLVPYSNDILYKLENDLIVCLPDDGIVDIVIYDNISNYANELDVNISELTFVAISLTSLEYTID